MDITLLQQLFAQGGLALVIAFVAYKAISKLYDDMREDSKARENLLMNHLDRQADINERVAITLERMDERIETLETINLKGTEVLK